MPLPYEDLLGTIVPLRVLRLGPPGAFLVPPDSDDPRAPTILLPTSEVPAGTDVGAELEVFVYLDSEDRPIATLRDPVLVLGEVGFLTVTDVTSFGAFVDWGLMKELLVPLREQTTEMKRGARYAVGLYLDDTGRLAGTMRIAEMLKETPEMQVGEWIEGEAWRKEPGIGVFVILERRAVGLVPESEPNALERGQAGRFRVSSVLPDGKVELSLRGLAHDELENDAARVLETLSRPGAKGGAPLRVGDRSTPEEIRVAFGLSKKAFKRAVGRLLKTGRARIDAEGLVRPERPPR